MAYITKEEAIQMREALKFVFPAKEGWKVGFRNEHKSTASVTLKKGLFQFDKTNGYQMNPYQKNTSSSDESIFRDIVIDTLELAVANHDNSDIMTDYFDVGYYKSVNIGEWNKPYEYNPKTTLDWNKVKDRVKKYAITRKLKE